MATYPNTKNPKLKNNLPNSLEHPTNSRTPICTSSIATDSTFFDLATRLMDTFPPRNQHFWWSKGAGFNPSAAIAGDPQQ
jgi:hypothetical protein